MINRIMCVKVILNDRSIRDSSTEHLNSLTKLIKGSSMQYMIIQYSTIQHITRQYNSLQYNTIQYNTIQFNTIQFNTIQYNTIQYNTIQYNTIQYNSIQYNTIQYNTPLYNTTQFDTTLLHCVNQNLVEHLVHEPDQSRIHCILSPRGTCTQSSGQRPSAPQ